MPNRHLPLAAAFLLAVAMPRADAADALAATRAEFLAAYADAAAKPAELDAARDSEASG